MTAIYRTEAGGEEIRRRYRDALSGWPVPAEHLCVPTREGETFVVASGPTDAPPLLLLHGSGTNAVMWMGDVAAWAVHFRVYAVDLIGEPGLSAPSRPPLTSDAYTGWLDDVLGELGLTRVSVVGASLGGWLALHYATRRPGRVERLVLLCPGGIGRQKMAWLVKAVLLRPFGRWGLRRTMESVTGLRLPRTQAFLDSMTLTFTQFKPRKERLPVASDDALHRLEMPVLVIVGEHDAMLDSRDTRRRVECHVPEATVIFLPGVGHAIVGQTKPVLDFLCDRAGS